MTPEKMRWWALILGVLVIVVGVVAVTLLVVVNKPVDNLLPFIIPVATTLIGYAGITRQISETVARPISEVQDKVEAIENTITPEEGELNDNQHNH